MWWRFRVRRRRIEQARQKRQPFHRARANRSSDVIGSANQVIFVRNFLIPQNAMQKFRRFVQVKHVFVAGFDVNAEAR